MAASSTASIISCRHGPPTPPRQATSGSGARRLPPADVSVSSHTLRRACVAAAACTVMAMAGGCGGDMALALAGGGGAVTSRSRFDAVAVEAARAKPPPRWSDRRQCPPWRANSLENIVPENLPRPSALRRFDSVSASASAAASDLVVVEPPPSFLGQSPGTGCFSL